MSNNNENQEELKIKIEREYNIQDFNFDSSHICSYKDMGNIKEIKMLDYIPQGVPIKKLDKDNYILLTEDIDYTTGEILKTRQFDTSGTSRNDNKDSLYKTFRNIRDLINTNFVGSENELHIILTYKENMRDTKKLYEDCHNFLKKLRRRFPTLEYIQVAEPQARGAWHIHMLCKITEGQFYIKNADLKELWGKGFVKVKRLESVDNIGAYLSAYLGDIFVEETTRPPTENDIVVEKEIEENGKKVKKKIVKGGRLELYPKGMNIYRKSKGIKTPTVEKMTVKQAKEKNKGLQPCFSSRVIVNQVDSSGETVKKLNTITYIQFNSKKT